MSALPLCELFAAMLAQRGGPPSGVTPSLPLEGTLSDLVGLVRRALPTLDVEPRGVVTVLARAAFGSSTDLERSLADVRVVDLYLAHACAAGDAAALEAFQARFGGDLEAALARTGIAPSEREDLLQQLREKLFVAAPERRPRILEYSGRGELRNWLRATAVRHAQNHVTRGRRELPVEDELFAALPEPGDDPELGHLKQLYRTEIKSAFGEAVRALAAKDRNILRYACVEALGIDAIAALYGVHRATAARWLVAARERLVAAIRGHLTARLRISPTELDSVFRMVQNGVSLTLDRHFAAEDAP